ncbi:transposase [Citreicella sp. SE45]|nr:transposase [Citreicella sp. SE45]
MNRTIKEATVKPFHHDSHGQLGPHLSVFMAAYNFARRLKILDGLTPCEYICKIWTSEAGSIHTEPDPPDAGTEHLRRQVDPRPA